MKYYTTKEAVNQVKKITGKDISSIRVVKYAQTNNVKKFGKSYSFTKKDIEGIINRMGKRGRRFLDCRDEIEQLIKEGKMSQQEIADKFGVDFSTISRYVKRLKDEK